MIPYGKHHIDNQDIEAVVDVLQNQFLTQGQQVPQFERALAEYSGSDYALVVNSATSALHVACLVLGIGKGDIVWTTPITFVASANSIRFCGADVDFVDIDPQSRNLNPNALLEKLKIAEKNNQLPKAIICVHFAGASCDMQQISQICRSYNIAIIEDACHALGGDYLNQKIGSCVHSDLTVYSFHPVKSMTTAEGGAIVSNNASLMKQAALYAKHGVTKDAELIQGELDGPWAYQQIELGFNYRMSDLNAALGISQLKKLNEFIQKRRTLAKRYFAKLAHLPLVLPDQANLNTSAWHLFSIEFEGFDRKLAYQKLQQAGIGVNVHYIPVHFQPYYQKLGFKKGDFPHAEFYYSRTLTLPLYPQMTFEEQDKVITALEQILL
ncbi:UDP-4-amino-4,6-dideoxy-N-acetyl-beta-L-altrosamine transaminase [Catenovulum sp. 2E275]|uniref:UDP-4-amino-4, 6-dideoxy-N-acetyl-beta-L-altrosamine transaminase n=1 Tax=Catenovulum sp. 2E275 TaxID=2980497 RepID=UPI0021D2CF9A|nr:UDP-4-amino-4,6-dideoxy-N-acetyl-beta-L-altrosamine transaminase [Catenovulum sp. 2E275]MCU4674759.1 UDP-4-amino-4,6-dideoxy-N-acetyl-beta-L-altrosamine transaminase [Catenovulum sp. 2E275]